MRSATAPNPVSPQLAGADKVLVVVGDDTSTYEYIKDEIRYATGTGKMLLCTRAYRTNGPLPEPFQAEDVIAFDAASISAALE